MYLRNLYLVTARSILHSPTTEPGRKGWQRLRGSPPPTLRIWASFETARPPAKLCAAQGIQAVGGMEEAHVLRKNLQVILKSVVFLLVAVCCSAQDKPASPRDPNQASPSGVISGEDKDSADIPPFARGLIDEETCLRLRDELIAIKRGLPDLLLHLGARTSAIRQLEQQEKSEEAIQGEVAFASAHKDNVMV